MRQQSMDEPATEQTKAPVEPAELRDEHLKHVAGGINPQPLPPRSDPHLF
jgi:hypothetical protein